MTANLPKNPGTIIHIGAGRAEELHAYQASGAEQIVLVEPNPLLADRLRRTTQSDSKVKVLQLAVTENSEKNQLLEFNLPEASSIHKPTELTKLFPGLKLLNQHAVDTSTFAGLIENSQLKGNSNVLVIQAPGSELEIVSALAASDASDSFSQVHVTCAELPLFESESKAKSVLKVLKELGFEESEKDNTNPDWPEWKLTFNAYARKVKVLKSKNRKLTQVLEETNGSLNQQQKELQESKAIAKSRLKEIESLKTNLTETEAEAQRQAEATQKELQVANAKCAEIEKRAEDLNAKVKQLEERMAAEQNAKQQAEAKQKELQDANVKRADAEKRVEQLTAKVKQLEEQLTTERTGKKQLDELKQRMEYLFDQQSLQMEQAANALGRHVSTTAKTTAIELEAGFQLQQQLGPDFSSLAERGNRLPSTVALQLSRQLRNQPYDLVIEMGSGVTTSFLAHTLRKRAENQSEEESESTSLARYVEPSEDDLPKRIICFEHNRATVKSLQNTLKQSGLGPIISLQYAPLVACQHQGQEYLYYGFGNRMRQLAQLYENRTARIFILLNDVASESRPDHIAALPQLLQYLSAHSLDIVVNTGRADANLIDHWHQLLDSRGLEYEPATEFGHQAVKLLKVNP